MCIDDLFKYLLEHLLVNQEGDLRSKVASRITVISLSKAEILGKYLIEEHTSE